MSINMDLKLTKSPEELKVAFYKLATIENLAYLLEIPSKKLTYYLYGLGDNKNFLGNNRWVVATRTVWAMIKFLGNNRRDALQCVSTNRQ